MVSLVLLINFHQNCVANAEILTCEEWEASGTPCLGCNKYGQCCDGAGSVKKSPSCPDSKPVESAGLCYASCRDGYKGNGPVCWQECRSGYKQYPFTCTNWKTFKTYSRKSYGRGAGIIPNECGRDYILYGALCWSCY